MLRLARSAHLAIVGHLLDGLPDEACGLLAGPAGSVPSDPVSSAGAVPSVGAVPSAGSGGSAAAGSSGAGGGAGVSVTNVDVDVEAVADAVCFYPTANTAASSRVYTVEPRDHLRADRDAEDRGLEIMGVVHSHTHTEPYPSPTDVAQAPDPSWHYVIVSFRTGVASLRSYRIVDGVVSEEPVTVVDG